MKEVAVGFIVLLLIFISSCSEGDEGLSPLPEVNPIDLRAGLKPHVEQDNSFAFELFKSVNQSVEVSNILISPFSVSLSLNMALNGARGETYNEMEDALRISGFSTEEINEYSKTLMDALLKADPSVNIEMRNSIWYRLGFPIENYFIQTSREFYNAEVNEVDFLEEQAISRINKWIAGDKNSAVREVMSGISPDAIMYLINANYFNGVWKNAFDEHATSQEYFYSEKNLQQIPMMRQQADFNYFADENAAYIELPYGNGGFSMIVALPNDEKSADDIISHLNRESWGDIISGFNYANVDLRLPRFQIETAYRLEKDVLPEMGMSLPFSSSRADFTGIYKAGGIHISKMIHKTFISIDENGDEGGSVSTRISSQDHQQSEVSLYINKPFLFVIKENSTGIILFMGKVGVIIR